MLKMIITGYLGADCRARNNGDQVAITFSVGVTKQYKNRQNVEVTDTTWVGCTLWRKVDNIGRITEFLKSGKQVLVEGEPSTRAWISNADNSPKASLDLRVSVIELLGKADQASAAPLNQAPVPDTKPEDNEDLPF